MNSVVEKRPWWDINHPVTTCSVVETSRKFGGGFINGLEITAGDARLVGRYSQVYSTNIISLIVLLITGPVQLTRGKSGLVMAHPGLRLRAAILLHLGESPTVAGETSLDLGACTLSRELHHLGRSLEM
jgi:hypothetical protein